MAIEKKPLTLKEAREQGKLDQFIKERENDPPGDLEKLDRAIKEAVKTSTEAQAASSPEPSGD